MNMLDELMYTISTLMEETEDIRRELDFPYSIFRAYAIVCSLETGFLGYILVPLVIMNCWLEARREGKVPDWGWYTLWVLLTYAAVRALAVWW